MPAWLKLAVRPSRTGRPRWGRVAAGRPPRPGPPRRHRHRGRRSAPRRQRRRSRRGVSCGRDGLDRLKPLGRFEQPAGDRLPCRQRRRAAPAPARRAPAPPRLAVRASAMASSSCAASESPAWTFACAPASARRVRCAGSGVSSGRALKNAAAAANAAPRLRPAGRTFEFTGDVLVGAFGRLRPVPGATVGVGRRVRCVCRARRAPPAVPRRTPTGKRPSGRAGDGSAPGRRTPPAPPRPRAGQPGRRSRAAPPRATGAPDHRSARPPRGQAGSCSLPAAPRPGAGTSLQSCLAPGRARQTEPARQLGAANSRGSSTSASGLPCVSATI